MNISLHHKYDSNHLVRHSRHSAHDGARVWRLTFAVLIASNSLLLFFLYLYDVI